MNTTANKQLNSQTIESTEHGTSQRIPEESIETISLIKKGTVEVHHEEELMSFRWGKDDNLMSFLTRNNIVDSLSEVRRLVQQGGVKVNDHVILVPEVIGLCSGDVIRIDEKKYVKVA